MQAFRIRLLLVLVTSAFYSATQAQSTQPSLLLDAADVAALKQRVAGPFAAQWKEYKAEVDDALKKPVELPPRGGNWSHNYVCPEHGARLRQGRKIGDWQWEHTCPVGPHTLKGGDPSKPTTDFDGNGIAGVHMGYAEGLVGLGMAYQVTGDRKYADRAREILLAYADKYATYPFHNNWGRSTAGFIPFTRGETAANALGWTR